MICLKQINLSKQLEARTFILKIFGSYSDHEGTHLTLTQTIILTLILSLNLSRQNKERQDKIDKKKVCTANNVCRTIQ